MLPRNGVIQDEPGVMEDTMNVSERGGHFHINLKPQSHYSDCRLNSNKNIYFLKFSLMHSQAQNTLYALESADVLYPL